MNGSINKSVKTCYCGSYLDVPSTMCKDCWEEYAQLIVEESALAELGETQLEPGAKLFIGSGEDVCLFNE